MELKKLFVRIFYRFIHLDQRRPGAIETFSGQFLRRVNFETAAAGDFDGGVVEHVGRALVKMLSRGGSVLVQRRKRTSLVLYTLTSSSTTTMYLVNIIWPMPRRLCMIL